MPGEERKFKRRRMTAFVPTCKREREPAASHTDTDGVCARGVADGSTTEISVGVAASVSSDGIVSVGAGSGDGVAVRARGVGETGAVVGSAVSRCSVAAGDMEGVDQALVGKRVEVDPTDGDGDLLIRSK